ncbi:gamma-glutamyl-gamma-aminobutyrate hydrolase family protein [Agreia pratensis]|uniref:Putative glutamine amidotransferase n=1 Tax=Agreia pratensis TaxID=150121 RepID=A0A1X7K431_9MICO|nr:gamma-glutamyl-gamma-aminobutyrate hydrolase family protein [Agreia pratensis]MBF4634397.1 gamma-glutamyl-gamma-aminobutyrate hydrolase family protein [Agreia pratensis]SMG35687.1 putative glutamine amidotransferase [Agreia pratensis]
MPTRTAKRLSVVEVTRFRPRDVDYHAYVEVLNSRAVRAAEDAGWSVNRIAAADVGTASLLSLTDASDAIMIMGGEDISPRFYGGAANYPFESQHFETADEGQVSLVHRALRRGTPLLGICRGLQIINVALGGTILQDLGTQTIHKNLGAPIRDIMAAHTVALDSSSRLSADLGVSEILVQSAHHQAVARLGEGLVAVGTAPDGVVEAVEHAEAPITGVQFHPEDPGSPAGQLSALVARLSVRERELA